MARLRYDKCVAQIKADLRQTQGRDLDATRLDQMLTVAANWFMSINPNGWPWMLVQSETTDADPSTINESLSVRTNAGVWDATHFPVPPRLPGGILQVRTRNGNAAAAKWRTLKPLSWNRLINMSDVYNRTAGTTQNQIYWALKYVGDDTATKFTTITIETYPYSYATADLFYRLDYYRQTPPIAAGANADDAFIWLDDVYDYIVLYFAEALMAHELGDVVTGVFERAWGLARELAHKALVSAGVSERRIKLPPPWIVRPSAGDTTNV